MPDDLRQRLVAAGVALVASGGAEVLTLREIARRAGVSHGAPRRYFPTHRQLLAAIAAEGFRALAGRIAAVDPGLPPADRVLALARVYLDFARAERGMFELMFRHDLLSGTGLRLRERAVPLLGVLVGLVREILPDEPRPKVRAGALWANLHGIALLGAWGTLQMTTGTADLDAFVRTAVGAHLGGPR